MILPDDFTNRMKEQLGAEYDAFIESYKDPAVKSLRMNRRRVQSGKMRDIAAAVTGKSEPESVFFYDGAYYYEDDGPGRNPLHEAGAYYIQEASAMLPVTMLDVNDSGQKVLDLCASPGGKSTQAADLMNGQGLLVANEIVAGRAKILSENIERMGVTNALVINEDPATLAERLGGFFDRILVDAPCSGEGMFRRNPEAVNEWSLENVRMCADRQDMILDCAAKMLAPGGRIIYSTCTFSPEEDEGSMERFLARHPEFAVCEGPTRLYPHKFRGEGHFAVAFELAASENIGTLSTPTNRGQGGWPQGCHQASSADAKPLLSARGLSERLAPCRTGPARHPLRGSTDRGASSSSTLLSQFLEETLSAECYIRDVIKNDPGRLLAFGDSIYLAPEYMPDIDGLRVLRAGLKLGTFRKNRFEPDHALSHALTAGDVILSVDLPEDSGMIKQYLSGMTLSCERDKSGWCLICVDGIGIGWGKASGGVVKNHYPKGLRKAFA